MALGEVGDLGGPVVHFDVDVVGVVGIPRGIEFLAPEALEVGGDAGAGAEARGGSEEVTAELEIGGEEIGVGFVGGGCGVGVLEAGEALVGGEFGDFRGRLAEIEGDAGHEGLEIGEVVGLELVVGFFGSACEDVADGGIGVLAGEGAVGLVVGGGGDEEGEGVGVGDGDGVAGGGELAAGGEDEGLAFELHAGGDGAPWFFIAGEVLGHDLALEGEGVVVGGGLGVFFAEPWRGERLIWPGLSAVR